MGWLRWRPPVTWWLYVVDGSPPIDISDDVLEWTVNFGCHYEEESGRFRLVTARGYVIMDNKRGHYDAASPNTRLTPIATATPRPIECRLGDEVLWQGYAVVRSQRGLTPGRTVQWQLRGRLWQALRRVVQWRQTDNSSQRSLVTVIGSDLLAHAVGSDDAELSPASTTSNVWYLKYAAFTDTLAADWNLLGWVGASIPFEDRAGRLGLSAVSRLADGRQHTVPATQRALIESEIESMGTMSNWSLVASGRNLVEDTATIVRFSSGPLEHDTTSLILRTFVYPPGIVAVDWDRFVVDSPNTVLDPARQFIGPAPDGSLADYMLVAVTTGTVGGERSFDAVGTAWVLDPAGPYDERLAWYQNSLPETRTALQTPPPWANWAQLVGRLPGDVVQSSIAPYETMVQLLNEAKLRCKLAFPLWAPTEAGRMTSNASGRSGQLVPGSVSRYRLTATSTIDLLTLNVTLRGAQGADPQAVIEGMTTSGGSGISDGSAYVLPIPDPDTRIQIPLPPAVDTLGPPAPTLTAAGPDGADVLVGWPLEYSPVDIARVFAARGPGVEVVVVASDVVGNSYRDVNPGSAAWDYRLRSAGVWGPWATITVASGPVASGDFDTLAAAGNTAAFGMWSDGTTMWVCDNIDRKLYAYDLETKVRVSGNDFNTLDSAGNDAPVGIWSDGTIMWVTDNSDNKIYAYSLATKSRVAGEDFNTLAGAGNTTPFDIWSDGTIMWVLDFSTSKIYAYSLATKARVAGEDFNTLAGAGNTAAFGMWSDGTTMWASDNSDSKLYAYSLATKSTRGR